MCVCVFWGFSKTERFIEFQAAWYGDPVFFGHYPESMVQAVGSRLPQFTQAESARLRGSWDFYGLNHYTTKYAENRPLAGISNGWGDDQETTMSPYDLNGNLIGPQAESPWLNVVPQGMYGILLWLKKRYNSPPILITENGVSCPGESSLTIQEVSFLFYSQYAIVLVVCVVVCVAQISLSLITCPCLVVFTSIGSS